MKKLLFLYPIFILFLYSSLCAQTNLKGDWSGYIDLITSKLETKVHFNYDGSSYSGTIDIPAQGAFGLKLSKIVYNAPDITFELDVPNGPAMFKGVYSADSISGDFLQAGFKGGFYLSNKLKEERKENTDVSFKEEEIKFSNGDITFAGTLTLPLKEGRHPAAILITGSGPQNRDENILGFKIFKIIAEHLSTNGIAVLRYDDRGVAESTGKSVNESTSEKFAGDVSEAIDFLKKRNDINAEQIGLIGHSEGGIVAPLTASKRNDVAFIVSIAGTGVNGAEIILEQTKLISLANGEDSARVNKDAKETRIALYMIVNGASEEELLSLIRKSAEEQFANLGETEKAKITDKAEWINEQVENAYKTLTTPWMKFFLRYEPSETRKKITCPVLAVFGGLDLQVSVFQNEEPVRQALTKAGNKDFEIKVFQKANHLFQEAKTGSTSEYATLKKEFVDGLLDYLLNWISGRVMIIK
ncbi:MAG: alpha/beta fold hydrolase [Candidatus Kapaibacterium sp.]